MELLRKLEANPDSGGIYHLAAGGHATRYKFAQAIIDTIKDISGNPRGWAKLRPIRTDQYPLPARRPPHPVMSLDKIKRVFSIELPRWEAQLRAFLIKFKNHLT